MSLELNNNSDLSPNETTKYIPKVIEDGNDFTHVIYENKVNPSFTQTRALFIANLNPDMDASVFKKILEEEAARENCSIERAWLNSRRTYCYVLVSDVPGATSIRSRLNGSTVPNSPDDGVKLYVDYIPVRALDLWIEQENNAPSDAIWKISYESVPSKIDIGTSFKKVLHEMINYENPDSGYVKKRRSNYGSKIRSNDPYDRRISRNTDRTRISKGTGSSYMKDYYSPLQRYSEVPRRRIRNSVRDDSRGRDRRSDVYIPDY